MSKFASGIHKVRSTDTSQIRRVPVLDMSDTDTTPTHILHWIMYLLKLTAVSACKCSCCVLCPCPYPYPCFTQTNLTSLANLLMWLIFTDCWLNYMQFFKDNLEKPLC